MAETNGRLTSLPMSPQRTVSRAWSMINALPTDQLEPTVAQSELIAPAITMIASPPGATSIGSKGRVSAHETSCPFVRQRRVEGNQRDEVSANGLDSFDRHADGAVVADAEGHRR